MARREGHIEEVRGPDGKQRRKDGQPVWRLEVPIEARPGQKRGRLRRNFAGTTKEAQAELRNLLLSRDSGTEPIERVTVTQLAKRWQEANAYRWKPSTAARHKTNLDNYLLPTCGKLAARLVKTDDLNRLYARASKAGVGRRPEDAKPLSPRSVYAIHETARAMFGFGLSVGAVARNPAEKATTPKQRRRRREPMPDEVVREVIDAAPGLGQLAFLTAAADTGARPAELCALRWPDLTLDAEPPYVVFSRGLSSGIDPSTGLRVRLVEGSTKTDEDGRPVTVDKGTAEVLKRWRLSRLEQSLQLGAGSFSDAGHVWPGRADDGSGAVPLSPLSASQMFRRILTRLGYAGRWELYDLKRWNATTMGELGAPVRSAMARLGHTQQSTTLRYQQARRGADAEIAAGIGRRLERRAEGTGSNS